MGKPVFIVSTGQTGTMALARYLDALVVGARQVRHEPEPTLFWLAMQYQRGLNMRRSIREWRSLRGDTPPSGVTYVESNPACGWIIPVIRAAWPESHITMIVRDPRTWIQSAMAHGLWTNSRSRHRLTADTLPNDPFGPHWARMTWIQRTAWCWLRKNERMLSAGVDNVWKFETLFSNPKAIPDLAAEAGLHLSKTYSMEGLLEEKHNAREDKPLPPWDAWPPKWQENVLDICGELMQTFDYE